VPAISAVNNVVKGVVSAIAIIAIHLEKVVGSLVLEIEIQRQEKSSKKHRHTKLQEK